MLNVETAKHYILYANTLTVYFQFLIERDTLVNKKALNPCKIQLNRKNSTAISKWGIFIVRNYVFTIIFYFTAHVICLKSIVALFFCLSQ